MEGGIDTKISIWIHTPNHKSNPLLKPLLNFIHLFLKEPYSSCVFIFAQHNFFFFLIPISKGFSFFSPSISVVILLKTSFPFSFLGFFFFPHKWWWMGFRVFERRWEIRGWRFSVTSARWLRRPFCVVLMRRRCAGLATRRFMQPTSSQASTREFLSLALHLRCLNAISARYDL